MLTRVKDVALLLGRIGIAVVFFSAFLVIVLELLGSIAFVVGFLLPVVAIGYAINMAGALISVHAAHGLTGEGGYELVLVLGLTALALGFNGGRLSLDHVLFRRRREGANELQAA